MARFAATTSLIWPAKIPNITMVKKTDTESTVNNGLLNTLEMSKVMTGSLR